MKYEEHFYEYKSTLNTRDHSTVWHCAHDNCQAYVKLWMKTLKEQNTKHEHSLTEPIKSASQIHGASSTSLGSVSKVTPNNNNIKWKGALYTPLPHKTVLTILVQTQVEVPNLTGSSKIQAHQGLMESVSTPVNTISDFETTQKISKSCITAPL